jgi:hypothetical protein
MALPRWLCFLTIFVANGLCAAEENISWSSIAIKDLQACRQLIEANHPAVVDKENSHVKFHQWLKEGYAQSTVLAEKAQSFENYRDALARYIGGFKDGHLGIKTSQEGRLLWPGFLITYREGKFFIASEFEGMCLSKAPPHNVEILAINQKSPNSLMQTNIFPYVNDDPTIESSWTRLAPFLLLDTGNSWIERVHTITYRIDGKEINYQLNWMNIIDSKALQCVQLAAYGYPPKFSIHSFGANGIWITIPTFKEANQELQETVDSLPAFRDKNPIVLDLRGNTGGASNWVVKIAMSMYGKEYLSSLVHIKNENSFADDRITADRIQQLEEYLTTSKESNSLKEYYQKNKIAYARGEPFLRRPTDVHIFSDIKQPGLIAQNPVSGTVFLLTDGLCASSGLVFVDTMLSIPGVIHIGDITNADTQFSQPICLQLPSGKSSIIIPTMIRRNWERGDNEPYIPSYKFSGALWNQEQLEIWVLDLMDKI